MRRLPCLLLLVAIRTAAGQSSIVPANHPIYDWLHMQRISGRLPTFDNEVRPSSRGTILGHLRTLEADSTRLSAFDRSLLREFLDEFDFDRLLANGLFRKELFKKLPRNVIDEIRARRDPYIYAGRTADSMFAGAFWGYLGRGEAWEHVRDTSDYTYLRASGARAFVNTKNGFGAHVQIDKGFANGRFIYRLEPKWAVNGRFRLDGSPPVDYDSWVSFQRKYVDVNFGVGSAQYGPAVTDPLVMRPDGPSLTQFRVRVGTPKLNFLFTHGEIQSYRVTDTASLNGMPFVRDVSVQRWVAMSRLTWSPWSMVTGTVYQMTTYSGRGFEPLYINPLLPHMFGQVDNGDRDNSLVGFDAIGRPIRGTELFFSVLVDDALKYSIRSFGTPEAKIAGSLGLEQRLPFDVRLGASVIHVDPWVYTHVEAGNSWEQRGIPIGALIGPNSDELAVRLTKWFPLRTRLMVGTRRIRHGFNPLDANGREIDVGGNLLSGKSQNGTFMEGADIQAYRRNEVEFESEPIRGMRVTLRFNELLIKQGARVDPRHSILIRWGYGF